MARPAYQVNEIFSIQCLQANGYQDAKKNYQRLAEMVSNNRSHFYNSVGPYLLYCIKKHSDFNEQGTIPHRLFFLVRPGQNDIIILHYFSVSQNEHDESIHYQKLEAGLKLVRHNIRAVQTIAHVSADKKQEPIKYEKIQSFEQVEYSESWYENIKIRIDQLDTDNITSANIERLMIISCEIFELLEVGGIHTDKIQSAFDRIVEKLATYLSYERSNIYLTRAKKALVLNIQLGYGRVNLFRLEPSNRKAYFNLLANKLKQLVNEKKFPETSYYKFLFQSIEVEASFITEQMDTCEAMSFPQNSDVINNVVEIILQGINNNTIKYDSFVKYITMLSKYGLIEVINERELHSIIEYIIDCYKNIAGIPKEQKVKRDDHASTLLDIFLPHLKMRQLERLLSFEVSIVPAQKLSKVLICLEWKFDSGLLRLLLQWCNALSKDRKYTDNCRQILCKILNEYKKLSNAERYSVYPVLEKFSGLFNTYSLQMPEEPQLTSIERVNQSVSKKRAVRRKGKKKQRSMVTPASNKKPSWQIFEKLNVAYSHCDKSNTSQFTRVTWKFVEDISRNVSFLVENGRLVFPDNEFREKFVEQFIVNKFYNLRIYGTGRSYDVNLFTLACHAGDLLLVSVLGELTNSLTHVNLTENSPYALYCAADAQHYTTIILLLNKFGYDPKQLIKQHLSPLLALFYKRGFSEKQDNPYALIRAINTLIQSGDNVHYADRRGNTALRLALLYPYAVVECLLMHGADPNALFKSKENEKCSIYDYAMGTSGVAKKTQKLLRKHGANYFSGPMKLPKITVAENEEVVERELNEILTKSSEYGNAPGMQQKRIVTKKLIDLLHKGFVAGLTEQETKELQDCIDKNPYCLNMLIPITFLADSKPSVKTNVILFLIFNNMFSFVVDLLKKYPINLDLCYFFDLKRHHDKKFDGTLLHFLARETSPSNTYLNYASTFIEFGASTTEYNSQGLTPLHLAALVKNEGMLQLLVYQGDANFPTKEGRNLMHLCAESDDVSMMMCVLKILPVLERRSQLRAGDNRDKRPTTLAKEMKNDAFIILLGAFDPSIAFEDGGTCLHAAASHKDPQVLQELLGYFESDRCKQLLSTPDNKGNYPLNIAKAKDLSVQIALFEQVNAPLSVNESEKEIEGSHPNSWSSTMQDVLGAVSNLLPDEMKSNFSIPSVSGRNHERGMFFQSEEQLQEDTIRRVSRQLRTAIADDNLAEIKLLTLAHPDILNECDAQGNTFLHLACELFKLDIIKYFVTEIAHSLLPKNTDQKTPLQLFCKQVAIRRKVLRARQLSEFDNCQQSVKEIYCRQLVKKLNAKKVPGDRPIIPFVDEDGNVFLYNSIEELKAKHNPQKHIRC